MKVYSAVQVKKCMSELLSSRKASWPGARRTACMRTELFPKGNS